MKVLHNSDMIKESMRSLVEENSPGYVGNFEWDS